MSEAVAVILIVTYALLAAVHAARPTARLFGGEAASDGGPGLERRARPMLILARGHRRRRGRVGAPGARRHRGRPRRSGSPPIFLGLIIIPIIGNAAEHATAVMLARKGQIDLALQIALGSSTQIALLVAPLLVFVGLSCWART